MCRNNAHCEHAAGVARSKSRKGWKMTTQISINITHGSPSVTSEDKERAEAAALKVLGDIDSSAAYAEYVRQVSADEYSGYADSLTGDAAAWAKAQQAADRALTDGWYNPDGAACEITA